MFAKGFPIVNAPVLVGFLGAYNLRVATPRELVYAGDKTSGDARSWYMISGDAIHGGGVRTGGRSGDQGNGRNDGQGGQVGGQDDQGRGQGNGRNQNDDAINDNIRGDVRNVIENNDRRGCTYKEFLACNPKEYDGKGGAVVLMREEFCPSNEMQKLETELWNHVMVGATYATYTDRFHELARLVPHLVTPKNRRIERYAYGLAPQIRGMVAATEPSTIQKTVQIADTLTDEALRNGSIKKNHEKRGNGGEPSKDRDGRDDNKSTRTGNAFATTTNPVRRENTVDLVDGQLIVLLLS
ncbi:hypothetical protein Tco_1044297 [Tanacetum coccineum]|uniref:Retrotransposon gag domain-containing protein n=1 Tax=Tanacetum coccineum TaxID=301880 RepID=A0ABQ5GRR2_9ASTR